MGTDRLPGEFQMGDFVTQQFELGGIVMPGLGEFHTMSGVLGEAGLKIAALQMRVAIPLAPVTEAVRPAEQPTQASTATARNRTQRT